MIGSPHWHRTPEPRITSNGLPAMHCFNRAYVCGNNRRLWNRVCCNIASFFFTREQLAIYSTLPFLLRLILNLFCLCGFIKFQRDRLTAQYNHPGFSNALVKCNTGSRIAVDNHKLPSLSYSARQRCTFLHSDRKKDMFSEYLGVAPLNRQRNPIYCYNGESVCNVTVFSVE